MPCPQRAHGDAGAGGGLWHLTRRPRGRAPCEVLATALRGGPAVGAPGRGDGRREWRETRSSASTRPEVPWAACPLRLCLPGLPGILTGLGDVPAPVLHGPSDCAPSVLEVKVGSRTWAGRFQQTACRPQGRSVPALTDFVMVASAVPSTVSLSLPPSPPGPVRPRHTSSEWQWRPAAGFEGGV